MITPSTTHERRPRVEGIVPERRLLGVVLLVIGGILTAGFLVPAFDTYLLLAISLTCLAGFAMTREYGYAIPAGITGGLGTAFLFITNGTFGPAMVPAVLFLSFAGGFLAVWVLGLLAAPRVMHPWPLVPATIFGSLGLAFAAGQPGAVSWIQVGIAGLLTVAGAVLVMRREGDRS